MQITLFRGFVGTTAHMRRNDDVDGDEDEDADGLIICVCTDDLCQAHCVF